ncbi:MAG: lysylphosphatidylglycerol synthase transmembrane domain-containing protein [Candidatus Thorarchaeota archaeon]
MNGEEQQVDTQSSSFVSMRKVIFFVIFGILVYIIFTLIIGYEEIALALVLIPWWVIPLMMGLSFLNYLIRYVKWQYYLRRIDVNLKHADSFSIFLAGFTLTATPGKVGEAVKGVFINQLNGTRVAKTVPVVISERVTDLLAMVILAVMGFLIGFTATDQIYLVLFLGVAALIGAIILGNSAFYTRILTKMTSFGPLKRFQSECDIIEDTMTKTLSPKPMAISTSISLPGWFMECLELWLLLSILSGAGLPTLTYGSLILLAQATFIHAAASSVGAVMFTPGGIGGYETVSTVLIQMIGVSFALAFTATLLIRFVTLWFSVIVGFVALAIVERRRKRNLHQT